MRDAIPVLSLGAEVCAPSCAAETPPVQPQCQPDQSASRLDDSIENISVQTTAEWKQILGLSVVAVSFSSNITFKIHSVKL